MTSIFTSKADRRTAASYATYPEAVRAVDYLADREFPVERLTVVARDLRYVEHVTGSSTTGRLPPRELLAGPWSVPCWDSSSDCSTGWSPSCPGSYSPSTAWS